MYKVGDIVRLATDDDSGEAMRVLEIDKDSGTTYCGNNWYDTTDLELYPSMSALVRCIQDQCDIIFDAIAEVRQMTKDIK
jgi:hypothetical protein